MILSIFAYISVTVHEGLVRTALRALACAKKNGIYTIINIIKTGQGDHSDKATTCPRRPLKPGPRDVISSQMTPDKEITW